MRKLLITLAGLLSLTTVVAAQQPELYIRRAHAGTVRAVAFSDDGRLVASAGEEGTVRLWDTRNRTVVRTLGGHSGHVTSLLAVSDKVLLSGAFRAIRAWDVTTGRLLYELPAPGYVSSMALSHDGKYLALAAGDRVVLMDFLKRVPLRVFTQPGKDAFAVAFRPRRPDGLLQLATTFENTIVIWDAETGYEIVNFKDNHFVTADVRAIAFSPDGNHMVSGGTDYLIFWNLITTLVQKRDCVVFSIAFSPDGKTLATGNLDATVKFWDVETRKETRSIKAVNGDYLSVAYSPDGKLLVGGGRESTEDTLGLRPRLRLWDTASGEESQFDAAPATSLEALSLSPDGKVLAAGGEDKKIRLWDLSDGQGGQSLGDHESQVIDLAFSSDGKTLASTGLMEPPRFWDVPARRELKAADAPGAGTAKGHGSGKPKTTPKPLKADADPTDRLLNAFGMLADSLSRMNYSGVLAFSPDRKLITTMEKENSIALRDVKTGQIVHTLAGHQSTIYTAAFSPDGKFLASGSDDGLTKIWDTATGQEVRTLAPHRASVRSLAFTSDGKLLASGSNDRTIRIWEVSTGRMLRALTGYGSFVRSVVFSPDGKLLAHGGLGNKAQVWDVATGRLLHKLSGHNTEVPSVIFSADGQFIFTGSEDATLKVWRARDGAELATLLTAGESDWMVVTPDGLFDGSPAMWRQIIWRFGDTLSYAPVEAFFADFYRPGLLSEIISGKQPRAEVDISSKDIRQPSLTLAQTDAATPRTTTDAATPRTATDGASPRPMETRRNITLQLEVTESRADSARKVGGAGSGAHDVRLFRNGSLVRTWRGDVLAGKQSVTLKTSVPIVAGENRFTAYAFNRDNVKSADAAFSINGAPSLKRMGTTRVLAVGLNSYANPRYDLKYAVADARAFAAEVAGQQKKLRRGATVEVTTLLDRQATKANILRALAELARAAQPEDNVVVYFAGHGTAQRERFYLIPHDLGYEGARDTVDAAGVQAIIEHSISDEELERAFEQLGAGQILLVIDACNSGQALEAEEKRRGPMNSKGLAQLAYEKGMYVLTAAQSYQAAQEAAQLGHGLLTYALVEEGLRQALADAQPADGDVLTREWFDYATRRVPEMQIDKLKQARDAGLDLSFADDERGLTLARRGGQRPRVFYRREPETQPLIIAKSGAASTGK
jgi:WD40 repeat protein